MATQELSQETEHEITQDHIGEPDIHDNGGEDVHGDGEVYDPGHSDGGDTPSLMAPLASLQTGYTSKPQPNLRWYVSGPFSGQIEFTLNEHGVTEPVLETHIDGPSKEGVYEISLGKHNVTLKPDVEYEWFIVIVPLPDERSADFLGSATIKYVRPSDDLAKRFANAASNNAYHEYAKQGYWYDAIDSLSHLIDEKPEDRTLRSHRVALLDQARLGKVVDYDRKQL